MDVTKPSLSFALVICIYLAAIAPCNGRSPTPTLSSGVIDLHVGVVDMARIIRRYEGSLPPMHTDGEMLQERIVVNAQQARGTRKFDHQQLGEVDSANLLPRLKAELVAKEKAPFERVMQTIYEAIELCAQRRRLGVVVEKQWTYSPRTTDITDRVLKILNFKPYRSQPKSRTRSNTKSPAAQR
jgi:Skp family chaperone for outer membrane proteins